MLKENLYKYAGMTAAAGWGFYSGWTGRTWTLVDEIFYNSFDSHARIAVTVGWVAGTISKVVSSAMSSEESNEKRDRRRKRSAW